LSAKVRRWRIPLSRPEIGREEEEAALRVLRSRWLTMGAETEALEREFADKLDAGHAIAVSSGTAALHLALLAAGVNQGDEVIQPAINFAAAANMTVAVGADPVLADMTSVDRPGIDVEQIDRAWTSRVTAVIAMHYGGYPCEIDAIREYCRDHHLSLIEDACHGVGAWYKGRALGTWGDMGCFSFFSNKNMAAGEGGMVVTNDDEIARRVRLMRSHGMTTATWERHRGGASMYDIASHGFNYRIDEVRAAIARVQLRKLDTFNAVRARHTRQYHERLASSPSLRIVNPTDVGCSACHLMAVLVPAGGRDAVAARCRADGIQTSVHYPCLAELSAFRGSTPREQVRVSAEFAERVMTLPLYPSLGEEEIASVCDCVTGHAMAEAE
jgi:dTDP-4-amino-4,6-dideoxygalactose transaminase